MTPEMMIIEKLLWYLIFTGFLTGLFFSSKLIDLIDYFIRRYRILRSKKCHDAHVFTYRRYLFKLRRELGI